MLKYFNSTLSHIVLATIISATTASSQIKEYIDTNYGDQGSVQILERNISPRSTYISNDSLGNIYISLQLIDNNTYSLIKINSEGTIDLSFQNSPLIRESEVQYFQKDNYIYYFQNEGVSTIVNIYDLNLNLVQEYRLADAAEFENLHYQPSGYFTGVTENFIFRYLPDGTLDTSFGINGLIDINNLLGESEWGFNRYEFLTDSGDMYVTFFGSGLSNYYNLIRFDENGQRLTTFNLTSVYGSLDNIPGIVDHKIFSATLLKNGKVLIAGTGWEPSFNRNRFYYLVVNQDLSLDRSYGEDGISMLPAGFETRYVAGAFPNNQTVLRTGTYDDSPIPTIAVIDENGRLRYDLSLQGFLNLDIKENAHSFRILPLDKNIYALTINYTIREVVLTKLNFDNLIATENITPQLANTQLSPNPTSSLTNLLYTGPTLKDALLHIYSTTGELISEQNINILSSQQPIEITTSKMTEGHYIVTLVHEGQLISSSKMTVIK